MLSDRPPIRRGSNREGHLDALARDAEVSRFLVRPWSMSPPKALSWLVSRSPKSR